MRRIRRAQARGAGGNAYRRSWAGLSGSSPGQRVWRLGFGRFCGSGSAEAVSGFAGQVAIDAEHFQAFGNF